MKKNRFITSVFVLSACLFLVFACSSREQKVADFLARGDRLLKAGDPVKAVLEYKCALQIDLKNVKACVGLGRSYLAEKDLQRALGAFQSALEIDPGCVEARVEAAKIMVAGGLPQQALDSLKKLKNPGKYEPTVDFIRAQALTGLKRYKESIEILTKLKDIDSNKQGQMLLAYSLRAMGQDPAMKEAVRRWRGLDPKDPSSYLFLAQYWTQKGGKDNAISELKAMLDVDPKNMKLALLRAQSLEALGFVKEAEAAFESLKGGNDILSARADFWMRRKDIARATSLLEKISAKDPKNVNAVIKLAQIYAVQGQSPKALDILDRTLKEKLEESGRPRVLLAKAALEAQERKFDEAEKICKALIEQNQNDLDAQFLLGKILLSLRKPFEAEIHLSQVTAGRPTNEEAQILLAGSQLENKHEAVALDTLRNALQANPKSLRLRSELLRNYLQRKDVGQALQLLNDGIVLYPENIMLMKAHGELEASRKNWDGAGTDFEKIIQLQPKIPMGYIEMGRLMFSQSKPDQAAVWFKKAAGLENGWEAAVLALFQMYMSQGNTTSALNIVKAEVQKHKDSPIAYFILGQVSEKTGDLAGAETAYTKASELAPEWPDPYWAIAGVYLQNGKLAGAIIRAEEAFKAHPSVALRSELTVFYEKAGRNEDAINTYIELVRQLGKRPALMNNLAYLYAESTKDKVKLAKAAEFIKDALIQKPDDPQFLDTAAWVAYKQGDLQNAWVYARDAMTGGGRAVYSFHAALILKARGEKKQALKYLDEAIASKSEKLDKKTLESANQMKKEWSDR